MPLAAINVYASKIAAMRAQAMLMMGEAVSVPHMEADDRQAWAERLKDAIGGGSQDAKPASPAQLALAGITVERVKPDGKSRRSSS
jgi:hypothetical protein